MPRLSNKVAFITGAGTGIGRCAAELFAREGANVVVAELSVESGERTARAIKAAGGEALFVQTDVTREECVRDAVKKACAAYGCLNILYNNAGGSRPRDDSVTTVAMDEVWQTINLDLFGTILCCRFAIPEMVKAGGGSIVNTVSTVAMNGVPRQTGYTVAKGGVTALTRALAVEYAAQRIRVNAVNPTRTLTDRILKKAMADPGRAALADRLLLGYAEPIDVAYAALYLASDESRVTTGHILAVDSGLAIA